MAKRVTISGLFSSSQGTKKKRPTTELWSDTHSPETMKDLAVCLHQGTLDRVRAWLEEATSSSSTAGYGPKRRLLICCGKPGCGKSTAVRVIAREMRLNLNEWADSFGQVQTWRDDRKDLLLRSDGSRDGDFEHQYQNHNDQFASFLHSASYGALTLTAKKGSSAASQVLFIESIPSVASNSSESAPSPLDQFRSSIRSFLEKKTACPAVLIFSEVAEKSESSNALERLFSRELLNSGLIEVVEFNAVTERKICFILSVVTLYNALNVSGKTTKRLVEIARIEGLKISNAELELVWPSSNYRTYFTLISPLPGVKPRGW